MFKKNRKSKLLNMIYLEYFTVKSFCRNCNIFLCNNECDCYLKKCICKPEFGICHQCYIKYIYWYDDFY